MKSFCFCFGGLFSSGGATCPVPVRITVETCEIYDTPILLYKLFPERYQTLITHHLGVCCLHKSRIIQRTGRFNRLPLCCFGGSIFLRFYFNNNIIVIFFKMYSTPFVHEMQLKPI